MRSPPVLPLRHKLSSVCLKHTETLFQMPCVPSALAACTAPVGIPVSLQLMDVMRSVVVVRPLVMLLG
jgi:hypothetical protein